MLTKLSVGERLVLYGIVSEYKGNAGGIYKAHKILKQIEIGEKESKEIELKSEHNPKGGISTNWNKKKEKEKTLSLDDSQYELLKAIINEKQDFTPNSFLASLFEKLGVLEENEVLKEAEKIIKK